MLVHTEVFTASLDSVYTVQTECRITMSTFVVSSETYFARIALVYATFYALLASLYSLNQGLEDRRGVD
jgi:hypothetical protein